jgi:hypothetical protein
MKIIKNIFFKAHYIGMYVTPYLWILYPRIIWFYLIIILSWKLNDNKCFISQFEYYFFGETFLGIGKKYFVSKKTEIFYTLIFC